MQQIISFSDAISATEGEDRALLLGNGFSIRHFSYKNLLSVAGIEDESPLMRLFKDFNTFDFEAVIRALEGAASVANAYDHVEQLDKFTQDANDLREALVHAVRETHPEHREEIEDSIETCRNFLCSFSQIFTLNYDLLLYWIQIGSKSFSDGFGLEKKQGGFIGPFKEAGYCNTFNLHGGLHLFKTATGDVEKIIKGSSGVIDAVSEKITRNKRLPVYVAEGTSEKKLAKINSVHYLRHCLQKLGEVKKNLFIFGHSADQNDAHIYRKIFNSDIEQVYFCIHQPTADQSVIEGELRNYPPPVDVVSCPAIGLC